MSLYDIALGDGRQDQRLGALCGLLGVDAPRARDAWVERGSDGEPVIAVYTRTGGGNREEYEAQNAAMAAHPGYLRDADDSFDPTYATWYFRPPTGAVEALRAVAVDPVDTARRWAEAMERIGRGDLRPAEVALGDQLAAFTSGPGPGEGPRVMRI